MHHFVSPCTLVAMLAASTVSAQERVPIQPPAGTAARPVAALPVVERPNQYVQSFAGPTHTEIDDEPDFTPTRLVKDGAADVTKDVIGDPYVLAFLAGEYKPAPGIDPRVLEAAAKDPTGHTYGYIMIEGRLNHPRKVAQLEAMGVHIFAPHTWQSFAAKIPLGALSGIKSLPYVRWIGYAQPAQKIDPLLKAQLMAGRPGDRYLVDVSTFDSDLNPGSEWRRSGPAGPQGRNAQAATAQLETIIPNGRFQRALEAIGFEFRNYTDTGGTFIFEGVGTSEQIAKIRDLDFVACVEPKQQHKLAHDQSQMMISADRVRATYHGQTITVGIIDSGIDSTPWHNDFGGKGFVGWWQVSTTPFEDGCEHGTHVCGTIFGNGTANPDYRGTAPNCGVGSGHRVFVGRYFDDACNAGGTVANLYTAFASNYVEGSVTNLRPRCINNSWGAGTATQWSGTESGARTLDDIVQNNLQNYLFAAGNTGNACHSPGSAKNALTVGSLDDFGTNVGAISSFSRSTVSDGRQKPEVSAPGQVVTSCDAGTTNGYSNKSGTSMATPHVTGALTGLIQHYSFLDYSPPMQQTVAIACSEVLGQPSLNSAQGWGCINAYKMHWASKTSWSTFANHGTIDTTGEWVYADIAVPTGIASLDVVWGWTEPAAAASATVARRSSIRVTLDAPPYAAAGNAGEYSTFLGSNNKWKVTGLSVATFSGQTVRVKLYGDSVSGLCRVSATLFWHYQNTATPEANLTISQSATVVPPSASVSMTGAWTSPSTADEFDNARIWPVLPAGFTITQLSRTTADSILHSYTGTAHPSYPWPALNSNGITVGQGTSRNAIWAMTAPATSGVYTLRVDGQADYRTTATDTASSSLCVDGLAPLTISGLTSSSHALNTWSSNTSLAMNWSTPSDSGCAGIRGLATLVSIGGPSAPSTQTLAGAASSQTIGVSASASAQYYNVRAIDNAANIAATNAAWGPFYIDTSVPVMGAVSINAGATYTNNLNVSVTSSASDSFSGPYEQRYSSNNATWSAWQPYTTAAVAYNLSSNGGNTAQGVKNVYVQVRDRAGNVSTSATDSIVYDSDAPIVTSVSINSGATYTNTTNVSVVALASGSPTEMRWSMNNSTWSAWFAYTSVAFAVDMTLNGGNTSTGGKTVYVQVRDAALNGSTSGSDSITYLRVPVLSSTSPTSVNVVNHSVIRLLGSGMADVNRVQWGAMNITSTNPDDWWQGYFRVISDGEVQLYPPQDQTPANYNVLVANAGYASGSQVVGVTHNTTRFCGSPPTLRRGTTLNVAVHRDGEPALTISLLTLSGSPLPFTIPTLVSMGHGGNPSTIIDASFTILGALTHDATKHTALWPLPIPATVPAVTIYFQALMFDPTNLSRKPIVVSTVDRTAIHL